MTKDPKTPDEATRNATSLSSTDRERKYREALVDAREMVAEWGEYASDYFKEKWDLAGDLAKLDAVLALPTEQDK